MYLKLRNESSAMSIVDTLCSCLDPSLVNILFNDVNSL